MKLIPLTRGLFAKVDDADFDWLNQWKWHAVKCRDRFYAVRTSSSAGGQKPKPIRMHCELCVGAFQVDHKDLDSLNNQRDNLRPATRTANQGNTKKRKDNGSGFKGVSWHKRVGAWQAQIGIRGCRTSLGYFQNPQEAALAYDAAAKEIFGEFARLNFPNHQITH